MKLPKFIDKILTIIGYIFAFVPYLMLGGYSAVAAYKLVTNDNEGLELIVLGGFVALGGLFLYFHAIIHEGGHLIGGLCSGWKFLSFRVGSLTLVCQEGKLKWKKHTVMGTGGQCLMIPPECGYEKCPFYRYLLGGGAANLLSGAIAFFVGIFTGGITQIICNLFAIMGVGLGLSNLFPAKLSGIMNDGYQMFVELPKNNDAKKYMYCLLTANAVFTEADSTKALPEHIRDTILELDGEDFSNISAVNLLLFKCTIFQADSRYEEMQEIYQKIADSQDALQIFKNEANCELLYYEIMGECNDRKIKAIYDKKLMEYIKATSVYPSRRRLMYVYYLIYKGDEVKAENEYQALLKAAESHPARTEAIIEIREAERIRKHYERSRS